MADLDAVMVIIGETIAILREENNPQWGEDYPVREDFAADIAVGELYVFADEAGMVLGLACLNDQSPAEYETAAWQNAGRALVIHRLAVAPQARRQGVASAFFALAEEMAAQEGVRSLRTDTYWSNEKMTRLFLKQGFAKVGECHFGDREGHFNCFEKLL